MEPTHLPTNFPPTNFQDLAWAILMLPLVSALAITLGLRRSRVLTTTLSLTAVAVGFGLSVWLFFLFGVSGQHLAATPLAWLSVGGLDVHLGLTVDSLSTLMLMVVTGVSFLVHLYSTGYMEDDPEYPRYFASLGFFTFSMLGIVLSDNLVQTFIFWELVGVSSYLLVGFWYDKPAAADAAKKAFLTNRMGDFGFILGILLIWGATGTVSFDALAAKMGADPAVLGSLSSLAGILVFLGAVGKSAQLPLHVWLPDAMEGPTPVSALIHAATMVAAGVYMLCRVFFLFELPAAWPGPLAFLGHLSALDVIAWTGGLTSLFAGVIAIQQDDIKRILHAVATRIHGDGRGVRRSGRRHVSPDHPCLLQGAALPGCWQCHLRLPPRAEHLANGRTGKTNADHLLDLPDRDDGPVRTAGGEQRILQ